MAKVISVRKNFKRFKPSQQANLLLIQAFTFGLFNARKKLVGQKLRQSDLLATMIVGEFGADGCRANDFKEIAGSNIKVASNQLNKASWNGIVYKSGGGRGRGNSTRYYLTFYGKEVFEALKTETGKQISDVKELLTK